MKPCLTPGLMFTCTCIKCPAVDRLVEHATGDDKEMPSNTKTDKTESHAVHLQIQFPLGRDPSWLCSLLVDAFISDYRVTLDCTLHNNTD